MAIRYTLGVTPELLKAKASEVDADIKNMESNIKGVAAQIDQMSHYWKGEAGDLQRKQFNDDKEELDKMIHRLKTYPVRLLQIAGIYESGEEINIQTAANTATDISMS